MLRPFSMSLEGVCRCVMASQHVWVPVTHWPCFFYWVTVQLSGVLLLKNFNLSTAWLHRTHGSKTHTHALCVSCPRKSPRTLNGGAHTHTLRFVAYAWVLSLFVSAHYFTVYEHTKNNVPSLPPTISLWHVCQTPLRAAGWCMRRTLRCHLARAVHWHWRVNHSVSVCVTNWGMREWVAG